MAPILLTGFDPFGRWTVNSSWQAVQAICRADIVKACLPVDHDKAAARVTHLIAELRPRAVLLTGLASTPALRLETLARRGVLDRSGPNLRRGRWDFAAARRRIAAQGLPARLSSHAGAYVCDTTYWAALGSPAAFVAFLHVPPLGPSWRAGRIANGISAMLDCLPQEARRPDLHTKIMRPKRA
ncbi:MAG: hypothetical protein AAF415_14510 [Pseudomonadota bacterium]